MLNGNTHHLNHRSEKLNNHAEPQTHLSLSSMRS